MTEPVDLEQVRAIVRLAEEAGLSELEVATPTLTVRVRRGGGPAGGSASAGPSAGAAELPAPDASAPAAPEDHLEPLPAPMVGTFYRAPAPDAPPFVNEGDVVREGQVVCIIEAMKLFNEIQADRGGRVAKILVESGQPVEYGQPLFLIDTSVRPS